jgi:hypothetical protein
MEAWLKDKGAQAYDSLVMASALPAVTETTSTGMKMTRSANVSASKYSNAAQVVKK